MTITYPVYIPVPIKSSRFGLSINKAQFAGEFARNRIAQSHGAGTTDRWEGVFTTPVLSPEQHREMSSWLNAMSADDGTFYVGNPDARALRGVKVDKNLLGVDAQDIQAINRTYIDNRSIISMGLSAGDLISLSSMVYSTDALGINLRVDIQYLDEFGSSVRIDSGNLVSSSSTPTESKIDGSIIPANATKLSILVQASSGANNKAATTILTKSSTAQVFTNYIQVNGAGQTGNTLNVIGGMGVSVNGVMLPGDNFQVENQLYEITEIINSDGSLGATLSFQPVIRTAPAHLAYLIVRNPVCIAQLVKTDHPQDTNHNSTGVISFAWQEVV